MMSLQCRCSPADSDSAPVIRRRPKAAFSLTFFFFFFPTQLFSSSTPLTFNSELTPWDQLQRSGAHYNFFLFFVSSVCCCSVSSPQTVDMSPTMYLRACMCACEWKAKLSCTVISAAHLARHIATRKIERKKKDKRRDGNGLFFYLSQTK